MTFKFDSQSRSQEQLGALDNLIRLVFDTANEGCSAVRTPLEKQTSADILSFESARQKRERRAQLMEALDSERLSQESAALLMRQNLLIERLTQTRAASLSEAQLRCLQQLQMINMQLFNGVIQTPTLNPWEVEMLLFRKNMLAMQFDLPQEFTRADGTCWTLMTINRILYNAVLSWSHTMQDGSNPLTGWGKTYMEQILTLKEGLSGILDAEEAAFDAFLALPAVSSSDVASGLPTASRVSLIERLKLAFKALIG
ncbi:MAG: hypothetical protein VKJ06_09020 [Vampirovibrionales bacterium]|nr:hypothetical protein [Vampirovibrionales bacterium]